MVSFKIPIVFSKNIFSCSAGSICAAIFCLGYDKEELFKFGSRKEKTPLEWCEDIEINRFLEMGMKVKMVEVNDVTHAVDFPEDVKIVEGLLNEN